MTVRRRANALSQMRLSLDVDAAATETGFASVSALQDVLSMISRATGGGVDRTTAVHLACVETPVGPMIAGSRVGVLILLEFTDQGRVEGQVEILRKRFKSSFLAEDDEVIERTRLELSEYFAGRRREFEVPLDYPGTRFEERVWSALLEIPYGETRSYEELATRISSKGAVRAVGSANGRNRIAIIIPCHRVINKSGALGGYGGGLWRKHALLALEQGSLTGSF